MGGKKNKKNNRNRKTENSGGSVPGRPGMSQSVECTGGRPGTTQSIQGHPEFGQAAGYAQYGYQATLQPVQGNPAHDMSKQVQNPQSTMYANSGAMSSAAHHHQPGLTGAAPSPQQTQLVNSQQQMNRAAPHMQMQNFFQQQRNIQRTVPNMGRNPMQQVVNQAPQQPTSQYSHVHMVPSHQLHQQIPPALVMNHGTLAQMYTPAGRAYPQSYQVISPNQAMYPNNWSNYYNTPHPPANGYYPPQMTTYPPMNPPVNTQQTPTTLKSVKKVIPIIDPTTGNNILDGVNNATPPQKEEPHDDSICIQFATQVAQALGTEEKVESTVKPNPIIESSRIVQTTVLSPADVGTANNVDEMDTNTDECEQFVAEEDNSTSFYNKENDVNSVVDSLESKSVTQEVEIDIVPSPPIYNVSNEEVPIVKDDDETSNFPDHSNTAVENPTSFNDQDTSTVASSDRNTPEGTEEEPVSSSAVEDDVPISVECIDTSSSNTSKNQEKSETKKKTKKKKEINKRGESKEGGDMDAFLDKVEELPPVPPVTSQVPATTASPESIPPVLETITTSPVPIVDSEILNEIPLPKDDATPPKNEDSVTEPPIEDISNNSNAVEDKENQSDETNAQNKIILKYSYKEDQWSPLNPEGKKQYDRDFLLQLQSQPISLCKPSNLPNLDVIKDRAHIQKLSEVNRVAPMSPMPVKAFDPFMPNFARGGNALRPPHPAVNRRSQQGRNTKPNPKSFSLDRNVQLHESENAWRPSYKVEHTPDETAELEELKKRVRGILNKLTPQKFEALVAQVRDELNIDTEEKLKVVIDLIFEKAIDEPNFSVPYANMCKSLALVRVPQEGSGGQVQFRKLLLTKCQHEFEKDRNDELQREDRKNTIEAADADKRKELLLELEEQEKKMRMRQLGNIRFIGELFKLGMLIEPIMHECIKKLLSQGDEESLECLCRLLKTIGKELEEKGSKNPRDVQNLMDQYFGQMQKIVDRRLTSSRVRFMLQDVIDLKKDNWVPRRDENNPKTIDQIHKEAEREAREAQQVYQNMSYSNKRPPDDRRKLQSGRNMNVSEDGWTPTSKSNKGSYSMVDPSKLKLTKPDEVDSIRLGPGGRGLQSWGKGSSGGNRSTIDTDVKTALTNRYSALAETPLNPSYENRRGSQRSAASSRESSRGRSSQLPPSVRKTPSTSKERENLIETVKELNRNATEQKPQEAKKADNQLNGKAVETVSALTLNGPDFSEDDMEKKTKPLIDEFLHNADFEEAIKCVMELASPSTIHFFIHFAVNQVLERSSQARCHLGQLLCSLVKKEIITLEQLKKGLCDILQNLDDYALDIPLIWEYMGEILEAIVEDYKLEILSCILEPLIPSKAAGTLVSHVLHFLTKNKSKIQVGELWKESGLLWENILGNKEDAEKFIIEFKLEFTVVKVIPSSDISIDEIRTKLKELLSENGENEDIFDWIDAKVPPSAVKEPVFIRALAQEVHKASIIETGGKYELDQATLKKRLPLLTRFINHKEFFELQALYAVQHLMNDLNQPKGVLRQIFDVLYDDDVITEDTFKTWEQCKDPSEQEGKGVALMSVRGFFTWLREAESGEDVEDE